ncbi:hypothetical protein BN961_00386 [Afipia felis]|uniref:Uncharacterized protein n=1 Tax=Afipia felis TaxID=1035 RepID=A0A090MH97_AFIFE|nr:hypothetical protein BN961_00386 [Afipia felis]
MEEFLDTENLKFLHTENLKLYRKVLDETTDEVKRQIRCRIDPQRTRKRAETDKSQR